MQQATHPRQEEHASRGIGSQLGSVSDDCPVKGCKKVPNIGRLLADHEADEADDSGSPFVENDEQLLLHSATPAPVIAYLYEGEPIPPHVHHKFVASPTQLRAAGGRSDISAPTVLRRQW